MHVLIFTYVGPTYKVKRSMVDILYAEVIEELYEEEGNTGLFSEFYVMMVNCVARINGWNCEEPVLGAVKIEP